VKGRPRKRNDDTKIEVRDARSTNWSWFENEAMDRYAGEIGPYAWTVYTYLIRRANKNGQCYPSYKTMATDLKISRTSVYNAVRVLEEKNLIKVESRLDEESGDPTSHLYTVLGVSPGDTPRSPDEPGYITTHTGVYHDVNPNNTQLTRPTEEETDSELERFWARARGSCGDDELAHDLDKLQPVSLEDGVLTLRAPLRHIGRRCRQRIGIVHDRLAEAIPVVLNEVRIVSGD
jgi:GntR family transcriptional regulator